MSYAVGDVGTLAEIQEWARSNKVDTTTIELMNQTNDILDHVPFRESNTYKGHETRLRTGLPEIYFRQLYRGTPISKSQYSRVVEGIGILEGRMELDVLEKQLYQSSFGAYRLSEGKAFMEALRQKAATLFFYGDHAKLADEFDGFATRYCDLNNPHVIDASEFTYGSNNEDEANEDGETGLTSMYLVAWGPDSAHGIFPKDSVGGLKHTDLGTYTTTDNEGRKLEVIADLWSWSLGLCVRDWRSVVRICNIKTKYLANTLTGTLANATSESSKVSSTREDGWINLKDLTIIAKSKIPAGMRNRAVWYCNPQVLAGLEIQSSDTKNVHLHYGEYFGVQNVPAIHSRPVFECECITNNEEKVTAGGSYPEKKSE